MASIGVRELRQRASELLRRVEQGETIEVTDRGRPVAVLSPPAEGSPLDRLRALGEIDPAMGDLDDLPEPLVLAPGTEHPSEVLRRLRRNER
jgi:prevent-host-death family protein